MWGKWLCVRWGLGVGGGVSCVYEGLECVQEGLGCVRASVWEKS